LHFRATAAIATKATMATRPQQLCPQRNGQLASFNTYLTAYRAAIGSTTPSLKVIGKFVIIT